MHHTIPDHTLFLDKLMSAITHIGIDVSSFFLDHICYRTETNEEYEEMKIFFSHHGDCIYESKIGWRMISLYKLFKPLEYKWREIPLVELPAPKSYNTHKSGWEHVEFVIPEDLSLFLKRYPHIPFITKALSRTFNNDVEIEFEEWLAVKFHNLPLEEVVAIEKAQQNTIL